MRNLIKYGNPDCSGFYKKDGGGWGEQILQEKGGTKEVMVTKESSRVHTYENERCS